MFLRDGIAFYIHFSVSTNLFYRKKPSPRKRKQQRKLLLMTSTLLLGRRKVCCFRDHITHNNTLFSYQCFACIANQTTSLQILQEREVFYSFNRHWPFIEPFFFSKIIISLINCLIKLVWVCFLYMQLKDQGLSLVL